MNSIYVKEGFARFFLDRSYIDKVRLISKLLNRVSKITTVLADHKENALQIAEKVKRIFRDKTNSRIR
jgi:hypothetical protein